MSVPAFPVISRIATLFAVALATAFTATSTTAKPIDPPKEDRVWKEVRSPNFTIFTDGSDKDAKSVAEELEGLRLFISTMTNRKNVNAPVPTFVYVFDDPREFDRYTPERLDRVAGVFMRNDEANVVALTTRRATSEVVKHEYLHFYNDNNFPNLPLWANEGLASYYSTFELNKKGTYVGKPDGSSWGFLRTVNGLMPLERFFSIGHYSPEYTKHTIKNQLFYAQSWLLMHWLHHVRETDELYEPAQRFLNLCIAGTKASEAYRSAFGGSDYSILEKELKDYHRRKRMFHSIYEPLELSAAMEFQDRLLSRAETLTVLGSILSRVPEHREDAERFFTEAIALAPDHAAAHTGLGILAVRRTEYDAAVVHLEKAMRLDERDALAAYFHARCLLYDDRGTEDGAETRERARASLLRSINVSGGAIADAYALLGRTFVVEPALDPRTGVIALMNAHDRFPYREDIVLDLLVLQTRAGSEESVHQILDDFVLPRGMEKFAESRIRPALIEHAERMGAAGEAEEGLAYVERMKPALQRVGDVTVLEATEGRLRRSWQAGFIENINFYLSVEDFDAALPLVEQAIAIDGDADLTARLEKLLFEIRGQQD